MERTQLATARYEKGWSQEEVAERVGVTRNTFSKWERGIVTPYPIHIHRLCEVYGKSALELDLAHKDKKSVEVEVPPIIQDILLKTAATQTVIQNGGESLFSSSTMKVEQGSFSSSFQSLSQNTIQSSNESKRNKSEYITPWLASANVSTTNTLPKSTNSGNDLDHLAYDPTQLFCIDDATPESLENFAAITETCRHLSEGNELKTAERILWAYLPRVESIAKVSFRDQKSAADITSQGYLLAASLVGHRNNLQARQYFSEQALLYGKLAQDRNLQITALRQLAVTFDYMESPHLVLQISQQAFPYLHEVSPLLRACIYAGVSGAYAQLHQKQEALHFMNLAYECFPAKPEEEPHFLHTICRYSTLVFFDGLNYLDLNEPHEAEKVLARIDGLQPKIQIPERVRIELLNYQIEVFITLRAMEQACSYLEAAVKAALRIGSERRFHESRKLFQRMQEIWSKEHRVQQLEGLFV